MVYRVALGLEYDGRQFCGWQTQPSACAVQDVLEQALAAVHGGPVSTVVAGRTDAGVHAMAQVVHFDALHERPDSAWVRGGNAHLPPGVAVLWARRVAPEFNARIAARERTYRYLLMHHPVRPALHTGRVGWIHGRLDDEAMRCAASSLLGTHDFSAFRAAECQASTPVRTLRAVNILRQGHLLTFEFKANAFLHHQVRNMMGALLWIGMGRRPADWMPDLLASRDRRLGAATFPPDGLYLTGVRYDPEWHLPEPEIRLPVL